MKTEFARVDPVTLETGLFKVLPKGGAKSPMIGERSHGQFFYSYASSQHIDPIGLRLFLVLCSLAAMNPKPIDRGVNAAVPQAAWRGLRTAGEAADQFGTVWTGDVLTLVQECGYSSAGTNRARILERLEQLSNVRIERRDAQSKRLLSAEQLMSVVFDDRCKKVFVVLGPHLAKAVNKQMRGHYTHICLKTLRAIKEPSGQILHAVLSNRIRETQTKLAKYGIETLADIPYLRDGLRKTSAMKKRRCSVAIAMKGLDRAGWGIFMPFEPPANVFGIIRGDQVDPERWAEYQCQVG